MWFDLFPNLAKLGDGLDESPTVMVGDKTRQQNKTTWRILKPSWAFIETKNRYLIILKNSREKILLRDISL